MKASIAAQLLELNRQFYERFAGAYSDSRRVLQPGIPRALAALGSFESLLDLGCGDGRVGWEIARGLLEHRVDRYVGVDFSPALLNQRGRFPGAQLGSWQALVADLTDEDWPQRLRLMPGDFDAVVSFSALHHIPSEELRLRVLGSARQLLRPGGRLAVSVWQLSHQERFRRKLRDWSEAGLRAEDVDPGDLLVDWQREGEGLRYVHEFGEGELRRLLVDAGFLVAECFRSDGESGDLGLYAVTEELRTGN